MKKKNLLASEKPEMSVTVMEFIYRDDEVRRG